ncbi:YqcC family protein [Catenovulum sp. SM1970]|uniref:YqcC family protein n=1 Tax=Marinifaba aquimaris TaxID=2741323 RepID=UPI001571F1B6|nr:YqcC family protein [Marinifaba aquimaris]NTS77749.1 YqcC family protein [Marinifaba aquimaris]
MQKLSPEILAKLLDKLEQVMKEIGLWQDSPPEPKAFMSEAPFCVDTMSYEQWLQWIFIAKLRFCIEENVELPVEMSIVPMAEEAYKGSLEEKAPLLEVLDDLDKLFVNVDKAN